MKTIRLFALFLSLCFVGLCPAKAQNTFQLRISNSTSDAAYGAVQNDAGDFVVACFSQSANANVTLLRLSPSGALLASKTLGTNDNEIPHNIINTADGGYLVGGYVYTTLSNNDWFLMKTDGNFDLQWYKRYTSTGNDYVNGLYELNPGRYLACGTVAIGGSAKPAAIFLNDSGVVDREIYFNTNQFASPQYNGWYLGNGKIGFTHLTNSLCVIDTMGTVLQNNATNIGIYSMGFTQNGSNYATLAMGDYGGPTGSTAVLGFFDATTGTPGTAVKYKATGLSMEPVSVLVDDQNNYTMAVNGSSLSSGNYSPFLINCSATGSVNWARNYSVSGLSDAQITCVIPTTDHGYFMVGSHWVGSGNQIFVAKTDSMGQIGCNDQLATLTTSGGTTNSVSPHSLTSGAISTVNHGTVNSTSPVVTVTLNCQTTAVAELSSITAALTTTESSNDYLLTTENRQPVCVEVYACTGQRVFSTTATGGTMIHLPQLTAGLYLYVIRDQQGHKLHTGKIIR